MLKNAAQVQVDLRKREGELKLSMQRLADMEVALARTSQSELQLEEDLEAAERKYAALINSTTRLRSEVPSSVLLAAEIQLALAQVCARLIASLVKRSLIFNYEGEMTCALGCG